MLEHSGEALGGALWAIVLAGGEGVSAPAPRPRALWRRTLETVCEDRRIEVTTQPHARPRGSEDPAGADGNRHVPRAWQVHGAGIYGDTEAACSCAARRSWYGRRHFFPAHWIDSQDPEAVVAVFPSDHFILQESTFMSHVANVAAYVQRESGRLVLFGATANESDTEYGWIEPGEHLGKLGADSLLHVEQILGKAFGGPRAGLPG